MSTPARIIDLTDADRKFIGHEVARMRDHDEVIHYPALCERFHITKSQLQWCIQRWDEEMARKRLAKIQANLKAGRPAGATT